MIVKCRANKGTDLGPFRRGLYYTSETRFTPLRVGQMYRVYAMALYKNENLGASLEPISDRSAPEAGLIVLVCHEYDKQPTIRPDWYPIELFTVEDPRLPIDWEFATSWQFDGLKRPQPNVQALWGYPELAHSNEHYEGLIERDPATLAVFRAERDRREREIVP